jgi:hypothetical protein
MTGAGPRLERRLDRELERRPRRWFAIWTTLVLLGFSYPLALATRLALAAAATVAFASGRPIAGAVLLVFLLAYLSQLPLLIGLVRGAG